VKFLSISTVDKIFYYSGSNGCCAIHKITHEGLKYFSHSLSELERTIGDIENDPFKTFFRILRSYRFRVCAAPLKFNHPALIIPEKLDSLAKLAIEIASIEEYAGQMVREIVEKVKEIYSSCENPKGEYLEKLLSDCKERRTGLLMKDTSLSRHVLEILSHHPYLKGIEPVRVHELRGGNFFDRLIIIGPVLWYPQHVFDAPRARLIDIIQYDWIKHPNSFKPSFLNSLSGLDKSCRIYHVRGKDYERSEEKTDVSSMGNAPRSPETLVEPAELLPSIDWREIANSYRKTGSDEGAVQEQIEARLFGLAGGGYVFLEDSENSQAIIIDLENPENEKVETEVSVRRISVPEIEEGMFILLRTEGGGDYILPLADKILGKEAAKARQMQSLWKNELRHILDSLGFDKTIRALKARGSERANETNIRNWVSSRTIRPNDYKDFEAIMDLTGLRETTLEHWNYAKAIYAAHRKAGHYIRKMLLKEVLRSNFEELEKTDKMDFELDEGSGGKLTAFRVEQVSPETFTVPLSKLGHFFEQEEN